MQSLDRLGNYRGSPWAELSSELFLLGAPNPDLKVLQEELLPACTGQKVPHAALLPGRGPEL